MTVHLQHLTPTDFSLLTTDLVRVHLTAMRYPESMAKTKVQAWRGDIRKPHFAAVIAHLDHRIVGFAYGFQGERHTWWDTHLRAGMAAHGVDRAEQADILASYFELAEIHVLPTHQATGLGSTLLQEVLAACPLAHVVLSTPEVPREENAAFGLYRKYGFRDLVRHYHYPADDRPFALLTRRLPLDTR